MNTSDNSLTEFFDRANPPGLDRKIRAGARDAAGLQGAAPAGKGPRSPVALGLLLLWHDHWEAAHDIAQAREGDADHDLLHALVHRREGDFANAAYWFRRAGKHAAFEKLAGRAEALLGDEPELREKILPGGAWNSTAFLDAVKKKRSEPLLRALQAEEFISFYETLRA